jgi:uncharacterized protein
MQKALIIFALLLLSGAVFTHEPTPNNAATSKPYVLGVIDEIYSEELAESRVLNIYLPPGFNKKEKVDYPIIYLLDGSADEDFEHVVGLVQFSAFEWVNRLPKTIIVGIATVDRKRDFSFASTVEEEKTAYPTAGHSDKFIQFLEAELQPFIAKKYLSNGKKNPYWTVNGRIACHRGTIEKA